MEESIDRLKAEFANYQKIVVHAGVFHADDVFTVAYVNLLRKYMNLPALKIIRTFSVHPSFTEENGYLVADIGKGRFDHHFAKEDKQRRDNGIAYASFGLVAREYHFMFNEEEYSLFDRKFIEPIDNHDNTGCGNQLSFAISVFNKKWDSEDPNDDVTCFYKAVEFATTVLEQFIPYIHSLGKAKAVADNSIVINGCVFLDKFVPIGEFLNEGPVNFIGSESPKGGYQLMSVKGKDGEYKKVFPDKYKGVNLPSKVYNDAGMNFCHHTGFLANFKDKDTAMAFMEKSW